MKPAPGQGQTISIEKLFYFNKLCEVRNYPAAELLQEYSFFLIMKKLSSSSKSGEKVSTILKPIFS